MPIFAYKLNFDSSIHPNHIMLLHKKCHDALWKFWEEKASNIKDWQKMLRYNPYFGSLPPSHYVKRALKAKQKT